jgi:hypothetical protein
LKQAADAYESPWDNIADTVDGRKLEQNGANDKLWGLSEKQLTGEVDEVGSVARSSTTGT